MAMPGDWVKQARCSISLPYLQYSTKHPLLRLAALAGGLVAVKMKAASARPWPIIKGHSESTERLGRVLIRLRGQELGLYKSRLPVLSAQHFEEVAAQPTCPFLY